MTNTKLAKRALISSAVALILCFSMLLGTTYAWFTDSVVSNNNIITAGNLDIDLEWYDGDSWEDVDDSTNVFETNTLWEPGHTEVVYLKVSNAGSLALKYQLGINIVDETAGTNVDGKNFKLSNYIRFAAIEGVDTPYASREDARAAATRARVLATGYTKTGSMLKDADDVYVALVVYMPETVGNEANYKTGTAVPTIKLGINLVATQLTAEEDSFGNDYDADALICDVVATPATLGEILANAQEGDVIGLAAGEYIGTIAIPQNNITLVSNTAIVDSVDLNGKDGVTIDGLTFYAIYDQIPTSTYSGGAYTPYGYYASITNTTSTPYGADDVVIKNCTFTTFDYAIGWGNYDPATYCAIDFEDSGRVSGPSTNVTIENCTFNAPAVNHIRLNYVDGDVVIKNNTFAAATSHHNINASGNKANWIIADNSFSNWADGEYAFGTSRDSSSEVLSLIITGNSFKKALAKDAEIPMLSIKSSYTATNSVVVVEDNIANNGAATIDTAIRADYKYYMVGEEAYVTAANKSDISAAISGGASYIDAAGADIGDLEYALSTSKVPAGSTVTIANANVSGSSYGNKVDGTIVFENCTFEAAAYSIHFDGGTGKVIFNNCTLVGWSSFGSVEVEMNNCTIKGNGTYGIARFYKNTVLTNCVFDVANVDLSANPCAGTDVVGATLKLVNCTNVNGAVADICHAHDGGTVVIE